MSAQVSARIDDGQRYALKLDPRLGAGNFLHRANSINPRRDQPLIHSDRPFIVPGGDSRDVLSIAGMKAISDRYAAWYFTHGVKRMDPVAVYFAEGVQYLIQYVALTSLGAIPVLTNGAMDSATAAGYFQRVGVKGVVTDRAHATALQPHFDGTALKFAVCLEDVGDCDTAGLPGWFPYQHSDDDPVMITHSSGTTGIPKPVTLQHRGWFHGIRHLLGQEAALGAGRYLSSLPTSHNAAIAYAIHAILNGADLMIMSERDGRAVGSAIARFRPETVVSFPQTFVEISQLDAAEFDLDSVTTWINSGDAAHERHIRRLVARGYHYRGGQKVSGSQFVDGLGSSEMGHSSFRVIHTAHTDTYQRCVGLPQSWVEAAVLDENGSPLGVGAVGLLGVRSPSITPGYWNDSLLTYRSRKNGYWLTGDLVYRDAFGCFYHVDRISDMIATEQGPLYSLLTEETILAHRLDLHECTVIGVETDGAQWPAPIAAVIPCDGVAVDTAELLEDINRLQAAEGRPGLARVILAEPADVPLGVTGKVLKRLLREQFSAVKN